MPSLRRTVAYVALWTLVALGFGFALGFSGQMPWGAAMAAGFGTALPAALLALGVIALCERMPLRGAGVARLLVVHTGAAAAFSLAWCGAITAQVALASSPDALADFLRNGMPWQLVIGVIVYALIAGLTYGRVARRRELEQTRAAERAEVLRLRAELGALRARLDPHFLFNVLQTLGTLVEHHPSRAHVALEHLAALLRRRLDAADEASDTASLAEELDDVRDYLALESLRFSERLRIVEDIDEEALDFLLPRFTLQPIVENAVHHGLAARASGGELRISALRRGDRWTLTIADDGVGADPERLASATGIGVSVVRERLRLRFGSEVEFTVRTAPGAGCRVELSLPGVVTLDEAHPQPVSRMISRVQPVHG